MACKKTTTSTTVVLADRTTRTHLHEHIRLSVNKEELQPVHLRNNRLFLKKTQGIPTTKTAATTVATFFLGKWVSNFGIQIMRPNKLQVTVHVRIFCSHMHKTCRRSNKDHRLSPTSRTTGRAL